MLTLMKGDKTVEGGEYDTDLLLFGARSSNTELTLADKVPVSSWHLGAA